MSNSSVKLSIIVPCYKVEQYLPACLNSLMQQTLKDIEVICINDGSPDRCLQILQEWEQRFPKKIVIIDKPNEGVWRGRWDGIAKARGEYIGFLDSDDTAEPTFAESLYTAAMRTRADVAVCGFKRIDLDSGHVLSQELCLPRTDFSISEDPGRIVELNGAPWNKVFRASTLKSMHDLTMPPPVLDDLMFQLLAYLANQGTVTYVPEPLVNYMVRQGSIINTVSTDQINAVYDAFLEVRELYIQEGASTELMQALDAVAFLHIGISFNYRLSYSPNIDLDKAIARSKRYLDKNFPTWRNSPYINHRYARTHGVTFKRLHTMSRLYKLGLLPAFLAAYRLVIEKLMIDVKW